LTLVVRVFLMWGMFPDLRVFVTRAAVRHCSGAVLCTLLVVFCTNARLARYEIHNPALKLASTQTYLDGEEIRKELSKSSPLVSFVGVIAVPLPIRRKAILVPVVLSGSQPFKGFDPESRLRPPPAR
jgi:hypothetical protein